MLLLINLELNNICHSSCWLETAAGRTIWSQVLVTHWFWSSWPSLLYIFNSLYCITTPILVQCFSFIHVTTCLQCFVIVCAISWSHLPPWEEITKWASSDLGSTLSLANALCGWIIIMYKLHKFFSHLLWVIMWVWLIVDVLPFLITLPLHHFGPNSDRKL